MSWGKNLSEHHKLVNDVIIIVKLNEYMTNDQMDKCDMRS